MAGLGGTGSTSSRPTDKGATWQHTQLILDVVPGRGAGFSLEGPEGVRFLTRSRVFSGTESASLVLGGELTGTDWEEGRRPPTPTRAQVVATAADACAL
ncbi:DUF779 domain-containing protein [Georgenia sp. 10Sc9-8]|uniref:DUF779 domain-containing protein n=1 Tax=Georgenia halotolerans TaxID=3028317 RepID=A0ABT5TSW7_9MICO|nr:DUF779 domain-containing protein [Georgenia halotolerans]